MRMLITLAVLAVASCGGGTDITDISSGFGTDDFLENICWNEEGSYAGTAVSGSGEAMGTIALNLRQNEECDLTGSVTLPPCIPVTGVTGTAEFLGAFAVETITSNPSLSLSPPPFVPPVPTATQAIPIGATTTLEYVLTSENVPGCPASDAGTVTLTRTG